MSTFDDGQLEDLLALINNFNVSIDVIGTTSPSGRINYMHTMLHSKALTELNKPASQNHGTINIHLKHITDGLLGYLFLINYLSKKKHAMPRNM